MGIYPDPAKRAKRPKLRSVAMMMVAIARMRYLSPPHPVPYLLVLWMGIDCRRLKDDWAEHKKGGRELKESLRRLRLTNGKKGVVV